jgi:hypothetical protein
VPELLDRLARDGELRLAPEVAQLVRRVSPATLGRLLARATRPRRGATTTHVGTWPVCPGSCRHPGLHSPVRPSGRLASRRLPRQVEADTASGFIVTAVEGLAAEHYRRVISEKTLDALARLRSKGRRGIGFWGGQCLSLADYVTVIEPADRAPAAGGC